MNKNKFLPISKQDMIDRGWDECDFVLVTGDAYVDHHSFGTAVISRVLENAGYKVGIIAQPDWHSTEEFMKLGRPRLGFLVNAGNMDSMVNHYTVAKRLRDKDYYSPGGKMGLRPDRATIVYCNKIREAYKNIDIVIGGVEASLRRFAHYDYWSDKVRQSMLVDSGADLLVYGMSEKQIVEVANFMNDGFPAKYIRSVAGTCYAVDTLDELYEDYIEIPSFKEVSTDKKRYCEAFKIQYQEQDPFRGHNLVQKHLDKYVVVNKPERPLVREELDEVYALPYQKDYHPSYEALGGIPAIEEIKFSIVSSRGCSGDCAFCAITFHQGRIVTSRSKDSIVGEAKDITEFKDFKGYIHDVGGPTANFRKASCAKQLTHGACKHKQCMSPELCKNMEVDHSEYLDVLRAVRNVPKVKKAFVRSGLRYDYIMADKQSDKFIRELSEHHVSGQLKVAPEHISENVLKHMNKPAGKTYEKFRQKFFKVNEQLGKKQYLIPYLMSSHPGSTLKDAIILAEYLRDIKYQPEQVQDFYPTPGTLATTMFYTELDPMTMKKVFVPKSKEEKAMQRALLQFSNPKNYNLVWDALMKVGREDLIGNGPKCLIKSKEQRYKEQHGLVRRSNSGSTTSSSKNGKGKSKAGKKSEMHFNPGRDTLRDKRGKESSTRNNEKGKNSRKGTKGISKGRR